MPQQQEQTAEQILNSKVIGVATPRVDEPLKTTERAMYSSDHYFPGLVYAWPTTATVASGTVKHIDTSAAEKLPGVIAIYTHENIGHLYRIPPAPLLSLMIDETRPPLEDTTIRYYGQYVAVAVAETMEQARAAAEAIKITYAKTPHNTDDKLLGTPISEANPKEVSKRGNAVAALKSASIKHDAVYSMPVETHNPIELHASVAIYKDSRFTLYETSQAVVNHRDVMAAMLGVPPDRVQVITRFLGSGFGGKLWP